VRTVDFYKKRAAECRLIANHLSLREAREKVLAMARMWDALAQEGEAGSKADAQHLNLQNLR
jgi:hypothetical protein